MEEHQGSGRLVLGSILNIDIEREAGDMRLMCECVLLKEDDGWVAILPQFNGAATSGKSREEALRNAREVLEIEAGDIVRDGLRAPRMRHLAEVAVLEAEVSDKEADRMGYVTKTKAAEWLGVSKPRVTALVSNGTLSVKSFGRDELVSIESTDAYRRSDRAPGRKKPAEAGERDAC